MGHCRAVTNANWEDKVKYWITTKGIAPSLEKCYPRSRSCATATCDRLKQPTTKSSFRLRTRDQSIRHNVELDPKQSKSRRVKSPRGLSWGSLSSLIPSMHHQLSLTQIGRDNHNLCGLREAQHCYCRPYISYSRNGRMHRLAGETQLFFQHWTWTTAKGKSTLSKKIDKKLNLRPFKYDFN